MPDDLTDADLDALEKLCEAATPGPWTADECGDVWAADDELVFLAASILEPRVRSDTDVANDAAFIAAARTALPRLIAAVRASRTEG